MNTELEFDGRLIDVSKEKKRLISELTGGLLTYRVYEMAGENCFIHIKADNGNGSILLPLNRRTIRNWFGPHDQYRYSDRMQAVIDERRRRRLRGEGRITPHCGKP